MAALECSEGCYNAKTDREFFASIARGRYVSDCGRKCGIHQNQVVEGNFLKDFHIIVLFEQYSVFST